MGIVSAAVERLEVPDSGGSVLLVRAPTGRDVLMCRPDAGGGGATMLADLASRCVVGWEGPEFPEPFGSDALNRLDLHVLGVAVAWIAGRMTRPKSGGSEG